MEEIYNFLENRMNYDVGEIIRAKVATINRCNNFKQCLDQIIFIKKEHKYNLHNYRSNMVVRPNPLFSEYILQENRDKMTLLGKTPPGNFNRRRTRLYNRNLEDILRLYGINLGDIV